MHWMKRFPAVAVGIVALIGCGDDEQKSPTSFEDLKEASSEDKAAAVEKSRTAKNSLEQVIWDIHQADEIDLERIDFARADQLYQEAIAADPRNSEAQFGAAVAHLLALSSNGDLRAVQDSLDSYMEEPGDNSLIFGSDPDMLAKLPLVPAKMALKALGDPLTVSDLQKTVDQTILPATDYALERLAIVEGDPSFQYTLTPRMLGDEEEEPMEIDLGEVYLLDGQLRLTKALLLVTTAYDFDFDRNGEYGFLEDDATDEEVLAHWAWLDKDSDFMTLKSASKMKSAKALILEAIGKMEQGVDAVRLETDDQEDDVVKEEDLDELDSEVDMTGEEDVPLFFREIRTTKDALRKAREILEGTVDIEADYDGDEDTPKKALTFDVGKFFDDPVKDFRKLLPYHQWQLDRLYNRDYTDDLIVTDKDGRQLGASPPVIFPDPSFGGLVKNIPTNAELLQIFGIEAEDLGKKDLLGELGLLGGSRPGGLVVNNQSSQAIEVRYRDSDNTEGTATVAAGQQKDVIRELKGQPLNADYGFVFSLSIGGESVFDSEDQFTVPRWMAGTIYVNLTDKLVIEYPASDKLYEEPWDPYESMEIEGAL